MRSLAAAAVFVFHGTGLAGITQVDPVTLTTTSLEDFESFADANYDNVLVGTGLSFAERFVGQTLSFNGDFDVVSGSPTDPLALQIGDPNDNLCILIANRDNVIHGLGPLGFPDFDAIGEGALAMLFDLDQFEFGIDIFGLDPGGDVTLSFFRQDGSLIDSLTFHPLGDGSFAFRQDGNVQDIAGVLITNTDPLGIGYDNIRFVPAPAALPLFALAGVATRRRRQ